jgi:hypothetical protein
MVLLQCYSELLPPSKLVFQTLNIESWIKISSLLAAESYVLELCKQNDGISSLLAADLQEFQQNCSSWQQQMF